MINRSARRIAHVDMDAFYASVELLSYPELQGLPVVIGGGRDRHPIMQADGTRRFARLRDYVGRGVITTCTYAARALGISSAMGIMKAAQLAPDAILLPVNFEAYRHYSRLFKEAIVAIAPLMEDRGIDEIYLDLTDIPEETVELGQRLKCAVFDATGLTCSVGISPNKLLSKICSDLDKPDGLTLLDPADLSTKIWPLPVKKINGIGPKATEKLTALGIVTIEDLAHADPALLQTHFGLNYANWLHQVAHGIDERPVVTYSEPKSLSRETTFEHDLHARHDRQKLTEIFTSLCQQVANDLERKGYVSRTIGIKLRYQDFKIATRDMTLPFATADATVIRAAAGECLRRIPLDSKFRLLGVRATTLSPKPDVQEAPQNRPVQLMLL